jgi:hypothetical protein
MDGLRPFFSKSPAALVFLATLAPLPKFVPGPFFFFAFFIQSPKNQRLKKA